MPVNTNQLFPVAGIDNLSLPALNFTQFLSPYAGLTIGKYATITSTSGDMNEFAHGKGATQFMNLAFNFNPGFSVYGSLLDLGYRGDRVADQRSQGGHRYFYGSFSHRIGQHLGLWRFGRQRHNCCYRGPGQNELFRPHRTPAFRYDFLQQKVHFD